jgi:ankyrin repeat protein
MNQLQPELLKTLALGKNNQTSIIKRLDQLYRQFGVLNIEKWRHISNKKNSLLHALVEKELPEVVSHIISEHKFDVNIRRDSDGLTPLQLAAENGNLEICELLKELGAENIETEDVSQWSPDEDREKALNIIWLDLEMTSIEEPEILECAVIITDKDLHELAQGKSSFIFMQSQKRK